MFITTMVIYCTHCIFKWKSICLNQFWNPIFREKIGLNVNKNILRIIDKKSEYYFVKPKPQKNKKKEQDNYMNTNDRVWAQNKM